MWRLASPDSLAHTAQIIIELITGDLIRRAAPFRAGLASLSLLAACSTADPVDIGDGTDTGEAAGGQGQMLHVAIGGEPDQLDPNKTSSCFSFEVLENVYDTL